MDANPAPTIKWLVNNEELDLETEPFEGEEVPRVHLLQDGSLKIVTSEIEDSGVYTVTADNGVGSMARKQATLKVHPSKMPIKVTKQSP